MVDFFVRRGLTEDISMKAAEVFPITEIEARIDRMPFSAWHVRLIGVLGGAHLFDAFDATALAFVLPVLVGLWRLTPAQVGLLISASYAGQLVGAIGAGLLAERVGRLRALQWSLAVMGLASLACAFAPGYSVLMIFRVIQGVGLGGETPLAATYMNETCPSAYRGKMITVIQFLFAIGSVGSAILALFMIPRFGWASMFIVGTAPILVAAVLRALLPESPRWLSASGHDEEARREVAHIEKAVFGRVVPQLVVPRAGFAAHVVPAKRLRVGILLERPLLQATVSAWVIGFCASIVGYGIIGWMPTIYKTIYHLPLKTSLRFSVITGMTSLLGAIACFLLIDRLGRKRSLTVGFAGAAVFIGTIAIAGMSLDPFYVMILASCALACLGLPLAGIYVYAPELYPTHIRAFGMGVASSWLRLASIVGPAVIGQLLSHGSLRHVYIFLAVSAATGAIGTHFLGVETKHRTRDL